jgi:hypothetical protein
MLPFRDSFVKLIPLLAQFLVCVRLMNFPACLLALRAMLIGHALKSRVVLAIYAIFGGTYRVTYKHESRLRAGKKRPLKTFLTSNAACGHKKNLLCSSNRD